MSSGGRTGLLPRPLVDPHSGQPGFKSTPASVEKVATEWSGFLILRGDEPVKLPCRSEEHTSELQSLMRISYAVFCLKKQNLHDDLCSCTEMIHSTRHLVI